MIVSLTALIAATTLSAGADAVAPDEGAAPLDDLRVIEALTDEDAAIDTEPDWLDFQGYAEPMPEGVRSTRYARRRDHRAYADARRRGHDDGAVLGPKKDRLRAHRGRFGLPGGGFVDMPGPRGTGGRIAANALEAGALGTDEVPVTARTGSEDTPGVLSSSAGASTGTTSVAVPGGPGDVDAAIGVGSAAAPALRLSFAKDAMPEAAATADEALATPLPASVLLFASGMGLLGLSRRRLA